MQTDPLVTAYYQFCIKHQFSSGAVDLLASLTVISLTNVGCANVRALLHDLYTVSRNVSTYQLFVGVEHVKVVGTNETVVLAAVYDAIAPTCKHWFEIFKLSIANASVADTAAYTRTLASIETHASDRYRTWAAQHELIRVTTQPRDARVVHHFENIVSPPTTPLYSNFAPVLMPSDDFKNYDYGNRMDDVASTLLTMSHYSDYAIATIDEPTNTV